MRQFNDTTEPADGLVRLRNCVPSAVTLLALGAGIFAIRLAAEGRFKTAIAFILLAALLDAADGQVARRLGAASKFGAELDSLADLVNFGVAPALLLYFWVSVTPDVMGWLAVMFFISCAALRLARFNVRAGGADRPEWATQYFEGVPAPAAALLVMLPFYVSQLLAPGLAVPGAVVTAHLLAVGLLMVSRIPTFSSKHASAVFSSSPVHPATIAAVPASLALLLAAPWLALTAACAVYVASFVPSCVRYRQQLASETGFKTAE